MFRRVEGRWPSLVGPPAWTYVMARHTCSVCSNCPCHKHADGERLGEGGGGSLKKRLPARVACHRDALVPAGSRVLLPCGDDHVQLVLGHSGGPSVNTCVLSLCVGSYYSFRRADFQSSLENAISDPIGGQKTRRSLNPPFLISTRNPLAGSVPTTNATHQVSLHRDR